MALVQWLSKCGPKVVAPTSPGNLLEIQVPRPPHPGLLDQDSGGNVHQSSFGQTPQ